jgi:hypothetical protein
MQAIKTYQTFILTVSLSMHITFTVKGAFIDRISVRNKKMSDSGIKMAFVPKWESSL